MMNFEEPSLDSEAVFAKTAILVSPVINNVPPDSTGGAIDMTLIDLKTMSPLPMGKFGVLQGTNPVARTFCINGLTQEEMNNRNLIYTSAGQAGLVNYPEEWWHYSIGDRYSSYYLELDHSIYGGL